jgi:alpha-galactosidase
MTVIALEAWAPGARRGVSLAPLTVPGGSDNHVAMAAGSTTDAVVTAELDADGLMRVRLTGATTGTLRFVVRAAVADAASLWRPGSGSERGTLPPAWAGPRTTRALADIPIGCLIGRSDLSLIAFGVATPGGTVEVRAGMIEESAEFSLELYIEGTHEAEIVIDLRRRTFAESVRAVGTAVGLRGRPASEPDRKPVLCTWYSFHQDLDVADLLDDARIAGELGIGTVIIDDGWQTRDATRGYGSCGDWHVERGKIADPRGLVSDLELLGLRTMWWIGTPFIGYRSRAFQDEALPLAYHEEDLDAAVLDPRSPTARSALVAKLRALLADTGAHGFKIDFLERFALEGDAAPNDADVSSIEEGALVLLDEIAALGGSEPLMIEFREPYITAAALSRGTMFRVADCPLSPLQNRRGVVDMRLLSPGIAVHGDPIMWSSADTAERVAQQLIASLYGVPQISVRLADLSVHHRETLSHWIGFWQQHSELLLDAPLRVEGVDRDYAVVEASDGLTTVTTRYGDGPVRLRHDGCREWHVVNGAEAGVVIFGLDTWTTVDYAIRDARGRVADEGTRVFTAVERLAVPAGGLLTVRPAAA